MLMVITFDCVAIGIGPHSKQRERESGRVYRTGLDRRVELASRQELVNPQIGANYLQTTI